MNTDPKSATALLIDLEGSKAQDTLYVCLRVVTDNGHIRNPDRYSQYSDLAMRGHYSPSSSAHRACWVGWPVEYSKPYSVGLEFAELMVKTLRRIRKHFDKLNERFGYAPDFETDAVRFADAVGATVIIRKLKDGGSGWSYDDSQYDRFPVSSMPSLLLQMLDE